MPSGMAVASSGDTSFSPCPSRPALSVGRLRAMLCAAAVTSAGCMYPPIQPIAEPTSRAASPTGMLKGSRIPVKKPIRMMASTGIAIHSASHIWAAGRIEMNAMEIPARVPSRAARGGEAADVGPDEGADQHDAADDEAPG